jgi:formylglycine-generating enzyme required for sulfatase activity
VERVSWVDAVKFANALSKRDGLESCYTISEPSGTNFRTGEPNRYVHEDNVSWPQSLNCTGYRLPTEAEWEVAARGGRDTPYAGGSELGALAWTSENSKSSTHPVGLKVANGFGLHDMTGNVWEWTWDGYSVYSIGTQVDPQGASGSERVQRGGSWRYSASGAWVAGRTTAVPVWRGDLGVRLARTIP